MSEWNKPSETDRESSELPRGSSRLRSESPEPPQTTSAPVGSARQQAKTRPRLLPLGLVTLIGLGAVVWLAFAVVEGVISRTAKRAEIEALSARLGPLRAAVSRTEVARDELRADRDVLQREVDGLSARQQALAGSLAEAHAVIERGELAQRRQAELDRALTEDRRKLEELERRRNRLATEVSSVGERRDDLNAAFNAEADRLKVMRGDLQTLRAQRQRTVDELRADRDALQREVDGLSARQQALAGDLAEAHAVIEGAELAERRQAEMDRALTEDRRKLEELERHRNQLATEVSSVGERRDDLNAAFNTETDRLKVLRSDIQTLRAERQRAEQEREKAESELARVRAALRQIEAKREAARVQEQMLAGRVRELAAEQSGLEPVQKQIAETKQTLANARQELDAASLQLAETRADAVQTRTLADELPLLKEEIQALEARRKEAVRDIADLEGKRAERIRVAGEISVAQGRRNGLLKDEAELRARIDTLERRRDSLGGTIAELEKERVGLVGQIKRLHEDRRLADNARTDAQSDLARLQDQNEKEQQRLTAVRRELGTAGQRLQAIQPDLETD